MAYTKLNAEHFIQVTGGIGGSEAIYLEARFMQHMLTSKQRSYLKALANNIQPIFQVGKGGISENMIQQFDDALEARELVKSTVLRNSMADTRQVCEEIAEETGAEVVQVIGNRFVLYRESRNHKVIELP